MSELHPPSAAAFPPPEEDTLAAVSMDRVKALVAPEFSIVVLVWIVRVCAVLNLVASLVPGNMKLLHLLRPWMPFEIGAGRHVRMFLLSMMLFILASGLMRGKRAAWICTVATLAVAPLLHFGRAVIWPQLIINVALICFLLFNRRYFVTTSDKRSVRSALIIAPLLALILVVFGTIRLHELRFETSGPDSWLGCLQAAVELILVHNANTQLPETVRAHDLFSYLRIGGTVIGLVGLFLLLRPVLSRRRPTGEQLERAGRLIDEYGHDPSDAYALLADKSLFFTSNQQAVIPYAVSRRFAVSLADPIGPAQARGEAIAEFSNFCHHHDWVPLFYQTSSDLLPIYRKCNFRILKIGEDARLQTEEFDLKGGPFQNLRTLCHRARKKGIRFKWYDPLNGPDAKLEEEIGRVSSQWLERKRGVEMTFDMGAYSQAHIWRFGAGVALDESGNVLAFTTWRPFAHGTGRILDLMRSVPEARHILDFALVESILHFRSVGIYDISLGSAPLANSGSEHTPSSLESRMIRFIYENLNQIYAYKPLFEFKRKYRPQWRARYLAYPTREALPLIGVALVHVHAPHGTWKFLKPWKK